MAVLKQLISLAHALADPDLDAAILAEGNVSARGSDETLWIKASGSQMADAGPDAFVEVWNRPVLASLEQTPPTEAAAREILNLARKDLSTQALPSTETFMHAYLLSLPGVEWVGHTHPSSLLSILVTEGAQEFAERRIFPDEVVLCGAASCWVPYVAPGLPLAIELRKSTLAFQKRWGRIPSSYWLQNHGLIVVGRSPREVECGMRMAVKSARILLGALQTGRKPRWLTAEEVQQIANWPDEHYRQRCLWK
jgi:rhamnose utilization protein RhaD (predicted bifunctional aldolase and dehydrogenase)